MSTGPPLDGFDGARSPVPRALASALPDLVLGAGFTCAWIAIGRVGGRAGAGTVIGLGCFHILTAVGLFELFAVPAIAGGRLPAPEPAR